MPAEYRIENGIIHITLEGQHPIDELLEFVEAALSDPQAELPARILVNAVKSTAVRKPSEVQHAASVMSSWSSRIGRIAVVTGSELHYGLVRIGIAMSSLSSFDVRPFRSYDEALRFLGEDT